MYPKLFEPGKLGDHATPNRFLAQPIEGNNAVEGGQVSPACSHKYQQLARGGWGVIVVEAISVCTTALSCKNGLIMSRRNLDSFKRLVSAVRQANPETVLLFQITHAGRKGNPSYCERLRICPGTQEGRLLSTDEIQEIKDAFVAASLMAEEAGADGIDFKCCHGYFGAEIIRPENTRNDRWGGSWDNRSRFFREGIGEVKARRRERRFIVGSRISMYEGCRGGCGTTSPDSLLEDLSEMKLFLELMAQLGVDYVNVSAGIPGRTSEITRPVRGAELMYLNHLRYTRFAKETLRAAASGLQVIGSAYSVLKERAFPIAEEMLGKGYADYIGWGRQILSDPNTPVRLHRGEPVDFCTACSGCSGLLIKGIASGCVVHNAYYRQLSKNHLAGAMPL